MDTTWGVHAREVGSKRRDAIMKVIHRHVADLSHIGAHTLGE